MKKNWFFEVQAIFKKWKKDNKKSSDCISQYITSDIYEEKLFLYPEAGGNQMVFKLIAYRNTDEIYLIPDQGEPIRTYLRKAKPF